MSDDKIVTQSGTLDISDVDNSDTDALGDAIESFYKQDSTVKVRLAYNWDRNHRFLDGNQWLVFDGNQETGGIWKRLTTTKANEYIPRPVTNYIFDAYQTLKSYLVKNKPKSTVRPNTSRYQDKAAAKVADLVLQANFDRLMEAQNYEYAAACAITYGTVFKKSFWDPSIGPGTVRIPRVQEPPQPDPTTGVLNVEAEIPVVDEFGAPMYDEVPLGDLNTVVVEPQRIAMDPLATDLHKCRWIMEYSIQHINWIKEAYGRSDSGFTGLAETVTEERSLSNSMKRFYDLKNSSGVRANTHFTESGMGTSDSTLHNQAVVKEYYERPSVKFPKGRMVVVASSVVLYAGDSPYEGPDASDWHPYSEFRWELVPGRFWGKSPLDSACEIQKRINSIDAVQILTRKTMAIPQKLIPHGAGIAPGSWTGRPGQEIGFRDSGGALPQIIPAAGVHQSVLQEREQCVEDLKTVTGAIDILKGDRPPGVTAASALNLLYEVGTGKLYPALDRWKMFVEMDQRKQLKVVGKFYKEPRQDFIEMLLSRNSELDESSINKFIGHDLYNNCNVIVEAGSNIPHLLAARQAALQEAAAAGSLNMELPANRNEYNRQMGITGFDNDVAPDIKRAEYENDVLDNIPNNPTSKPIILEVDQDDIHIDVHARRMKEPSFLALDSTVQQAYMAHYMEHINQQSQKAQQQAMEAMSMGQPPGGAPQGNAPQPVHGHGKGPTKATATALKTDAMVPGNPSGAVRGK